MNWKTQAMLKCDQHHYKSPAMDILTYLWLIYYPNWGHLVDFFLIRGWKIPGIRLGIELTI